MQHKINKQKTNARLAAYDIWPGNGEGLFLFWCFINMSLTYLLRHLPTYLQPRDPHRVHPQGKAPTTPQYFLIHQSPFMPALWSMNVWLVDFAQITYELIHVQTPSIIESAAQTCIYLTSAKWQRSWTIPCMWRSLRNMHSSIKLFFRKNNSLVRICTVCCLSSSSQSISVALLSSSSVTVSTWTGSDARSVPCVTYTDTTPNNYSTICSLYT